MTTYPKGAIGGKDVRDDPRLDAVQDAIEGLARRADTLMVRHEGRADGGLSQEGLTITRVWVKQNVAPEDQAGAVEKIAAEARRAPLSASLDDYDLRHYAKKVGLKLAGRSDSTDCGPDNTLTTPGQGRSDADHFATSENSRWGWRPKIMGPSGMSYLGADTYATEAEAMKVAQQCLNQNFHLRGDPRDKYRADDVEPGRPYNAYPNTPANAKAVGWGSLPEHCEGDPSCEYVFHNHHRGTFRYTNSVPENAQLVRADAKPPEEQIKDLEYQLNTGYPSGGETAREWDARLRKKIEELKREQQSRADASFGSDDDLRSEYDRVTASIGKLKRSVEMADAKQHVQEKIDELSGRAQALQKEIENQQGYASEKNEGAEEEMDAQRRRDEGRADATARTDPPTSESQRRFMRWAAENPGESGVSGKVSGEFNESDPGGKLPERKDAATPWPDWREQMEAYLTQPQYERQYAEALWESGWTPQRAAKELSKPEKTGRR